MTGEAHTPRNFPERFVSWTGRAVSWLTLVMVLLSFTVVVLRYGFNLGWIWMQESVTYLHATVFMVAAAWALQIDEHVRVDIFYRERSPSQKAWINAAGTILFLLPVCVFLLIKAWPYVTTSWAIRESSQEASGLPWVYALKTLVLLMPALLILQAGNLLYGCYRTLRPSGR